MCGSIRLEGQKDFIRIKNQIPAAFLLQNHHGLESYLWNGFARTDGSRDNVFTLSDQFPEDIWIPEILRVNGFTDIDRRLQKKMRRENGLQDQTQKLSNEQIREKCTKVLAAKRIVVLTAADGRMRVLTRPSRTEDEISVHDRMPLIIPAIMTREQFLYDFNNRVTANYH